MNEELYQLFDGELPDDASAKLFQGLASDPAQRAIFRQQMRLQSALHRNEQYQTMTSGEDTDILSRIGPAIGLTSSGAWLTGKMLALAAAMLLVGGGAGFFANAWVNPDQTFRPEDVVRHAAEHPAMIPPMAPPCNCDSAVAVVRDSVAQAATQTNAQKNRMSRKTSRFPKDRDKPVTGVNPPKTSPPAP